MKHIIRTMILFVALTMGATNTAWAQDTPTLSSENIKINKFPKDVLNTDGTVKEVVGGRVSASVNGRVVTLTITEKKSGYDINKNMITVEPMISADLARRRSESVLANTITVDGSGDTYTFTLPEKYSGANVTVRFFKTAAEGVTQIFSLSELSSTGNYELVCDVDASNYTTIATFTGTLTGQAKDDGTFPVIWNLSKPLFATATDAKISNLMLDKVYISQAGQTGSIACVANGTTRIYNCGILSGSVGSTGTSTSDDYTDCCGGFVGFLDDEARVVNCFSYANIIGGNRVGGIVGYNNVATTSSNLKTMVMNCLFYGDITDGTNKAPIYNGQLITNRGDANGVGNYNYFRLEAPYVQPTGVNYNCALGAEDRFLNRFEFYRHLLNSHRELAGWWATGTYSGDSMLKWVLEPSQLGTATPYPILKESGKYPSVVNIDVNHSEIYKGRDLTVGRKLGTLSVTIQMGDGAVYERPSGAAITTQQLSLNITDKDPDHFNFNYYKVQLPYYNDVGTGNYTGNRVVTGWKIVNIEGGTPGTFTASDTWGGYNFADRNCTNKDLYGTGGSNRIFNQGAYWDVPEGVTSITIEPYWAKCVYLADPNADKIYKSDMSAGYDVSNVGGGTIYTNGKKYNLATHSLDETNGQIVYTTIGNAIASTALYADYTDAERNSHSVYDYAVVLVGNYHHYYTTGKIEASKSKPYTVTSIDLDGDNEPDYSYILRFDGRCECHPVRADFINIPGLGMAQKSTGGTGSYNFGILIPKGWFESTNTSLLRFTQFEYEHSAKSESETDALIVQGGVMEQWVSYNQKGRSNKIPYIHVGGNVWFKEFHTGCHQDKNQSSGGNRFQPTKHSPISVTGGDFDEFYLTGLYVANANLDNYADNAECYINGGRFGTVCGAAMEGIGKANGSDNTGNITWQIQNADIKEFYAGGLNAAKPVTGNLSTTIIDSHVDIFCGGPKFGDMSANKTVVTNATGCTFGTFFGAGYGGNSYSRYAPSNQNNVTNINWNNWVKGQYTRSYNGTYGGVSTQFNYQFLPMSDNKTNVARILVDFVKFSLATTRNVTSNLTGCTITNNFYGGGSLGKVDGNVTSTLTNCTVNGSVFGAGFSGNLPPVEVDDPNGFATEPYYYEALGTYRTGVKRATTTYTWKEKKSSDPWVDNTDHILYTTENLNDLGTVSGNVTLNILGDQTHITGDVYGGAAEAKSNTDYYKDTNPDSNTATTVNLLGGTINGSVYGGGLGYLGKKKESNPNEYEKDPVAADVGNTTLNLNGVPYTTVTATQTLYTTDWGLVKDETSDGTPYVVDDAAKGCIVGGNIFGCNNLNGTPKGLAKVHVYKTQNAAATRITNPAEGEKTAKVDGRYDVKAVYGGGNLAPYIPTNSELPYTTANETTLNKIYAEVIIDGCGRTSIGQVYGGGNAASSPATKVDVNGTYEIGELFGGGNGKDDISKDGGVTWIANPGANVGYRAYEDDATDAQTPADRAENYAYGSGKAEVNIYGGKIHAIYGGSNTKGNVRRIAVAMLEELQGSDNKPKCAFNVDEAYGGGKSATMDGEAHLEMKCIPGLKAAYGGAENADIQNNVTINITNGKFSQVFGGNNMGGRIMGGITVNVEETGCRPVIIGELYGGGNRASYSVYGYKPETDEDGIVYDEFGKIRWLPLVENETATAASETYTALTGTNKYPYPQVNVKSFTSIGEVYGGGYGTTATMVGDPHVNINVVMGDKTNHNEAKIETEGTLEIVDETEDHVETTREVKYPTHTQGKIGAIRNVFGGGNAARVVGDTYVKIGTDETVDYVTTASGEDDPRTGISVVGADIRGNVYGGGNKAEVTGNTNVVIGK